MLCLAPKRIDASSLPVLLPHKHRNQRLLWLSLSCCGKRRFTRAPTPQCKPQQCKGSNYGWGCNSLRSFSLSKAHYPETGTLAGKVSVIAADKHSRGSECPSADKGGGCRVAHIKKVKHNARGQIGVVATDKDIPGSKMGIVRPGDGGVCGVAYIDYPKPVKAFNQIGAVAADKNPISTIRRS